MKNFKKILCGVLSVTALSTCLVIPTSAEVVYDDLQTTTSEGGYITYYLPDDFTIQAVLDDEDQTLVLNGQKLKFIDSYVHDHSKDFIPGFDTEVDNTIDYIYNFSIEGKYDDSPYDLTYCVYMLKDVENHPESEVTNKEIGETPYNISPEPDNKDDLTIGNSKATGVRGDINYDGKVTTADLLLLKKYLLGITTW